MRKLFKIRMHGFPTVIDSGQTSNKIRLIKAFRAAFGIGLKEAKDLAEASENLILVVTGDEYGMLSASLMESSIPWVLTHCEEYKDDAVHYHTLWAKVSAAIYTPTE
jgi:hypothetical protein